MNTTELIAQVRKDVFIGDTVFPDYGDADILLELNRVLRTTFERAITQSRSGYWQKNKYFEVVPGRCNYRIPDRAIGGGLEQVALCDATSVVNGVPDGRCYKIDEVTETHAQYYEPGPSQTGIVMKYAVRGNWVELLPAPSSTCTLRMTYYLRPSTLIAKSSDGLITAVDAAGSDLTVNQRPASIDPQENVDIIHVGGWYDVEGLNFPQPAVSGDPQDVKIIGEDFFGAGGGSSIDWTRFGEGDYVRKAGETDWPALPEDFHSTLAKLTAVNVMTQLNMLEKKSVTEAAAGMEFERFVDMLKSRVKTEAEVLKAPRSVLQVGRGQRSFGGWR